MTYSCRDNSFSVQDSGLDLGQDITFVGFADDLDDNYGLVSPEETVVVRSYSDDSDDQVLSELQPRYIIMFEPNLDFVRRVEVSFLSSHRRSG